MSVQVAGDDPSRRFTAEEVCRQYGFDPDNMSEVDHLNELCVVARYLAETLLHYVSRINSDLPLSTSRTDDVAREIFESQKNRA